MYMYVLPFFYDNLFQVVRTWKIEPAHGQLVGTYYCLIKRDLDAATVYGIHLGVDLSYISKGDSSMQGDPHNLLGIVFYFKMISN